MSWDDEWGKDQIPFGMPMPKPGETYPSNDKRLAPPSSIQQRKLEKRALKNQIEAQKAYKRQVRKAKVGVAWHYVYVAAIVIVLGTLLINKLLHGEPLIDPTNNQIPGLGK